jgi:hypothetical protein
MAVSPLADAGIQKAVLDANGDVQVSGSYRFGFDADIYLAKLKSASGAFLWETTWDGGMYTGEGLAHLAMMPDGYPVISATHEALPVNGVPINDDFVTVRFGPPPPVVTVANASDRTSTGLTLHGTVNPRGLATTAQFEYGPTPAFGRTQAVTLTAPEGDTPEEVSVNLTGLAPGSNLHYRLTATNINGTAATITRTDYLWTDLQDWRLQHFAAPGGFGTGADDADPDNDQLPNLIEWACGTDPLHYSPPPLTVTVEAQHLVFTYSRRSAAPATGAVFGVEWSTSLSGAPWSQANVTQEITGEAGGIQTVRATVPLAGTPSLFARLRVSNAW